MATDSLISFFSRRSNTPYYDSCLFVWIGLLIGVITVRNTGNNLHISTPPEPHQTRAGPIRTVSTARHPTWLNPPPPPLVTQPNSSRAMPIRVNLDFSHGAKKYYVISSSINHSELTNSLTPRSLACTSGRVQINQSKCLVLIAYFSSLVKLNNKQQTHSNSLII